MISTLRECAVRCRSPNSKNIIYCNVMLYFHQLKQWLQSAIRNGTIASCVWTFPCGIIASVCGSMCDMRLTHISCLQLHPWESSLPQPHQPLPEPPLPQPQLHLLQLSPQPPGRAVPGPREGGQQWPGHAPGLLGLDVSPAGEGRGGKGARAGRAAVEERDGCRRGPEWRRRPPAETFRQTHGPDQSQIWRPTRRWRRRRWRRWRRWRWRRRRRRRPRRRWMWGRDEGRQRLVPPGQPSGHVLQLLQELWGGLLLQGSDVQVGQASQRAVSETRGQAQEERRRRGLPQPLPAFGVGDDGWAATQNAGRQEAEFASRGGQRKEQKDK